MRMAQPSGGLRRRPIRASRPRLPPAWLHRWRGRNLDRSTQHARQAVTGQRTLLRRVRDTAYSATLGYGYRPGRVLWLLALLLVLVAGSLEIPASRSAMRATTS